MKDVLHMWTIYDRPDDHPKGVVLRRWLVSAAGEPEDMGASFFLSVEGARLAVPAGLVCLPRDPSDPKCVVETWL